MSRWTPKRFCDEWLGLFQQFANEHPEEFSDDEELDPAEEEALSKALDKKIKDYIDAHASPLLYEWRKVSARHGDEGELCDKDGSFLRTADGYPIQGWKISDDKRIVDENGNQLYYSDGTPIMAKQMSVELFEFLKNDESGFFEDATEEDRWY